VKETEMSTAPTTGRTRGGARLAFMVGTPVATAALLAAHPAEPRDIQVLAESTTTWLVVHLGLLAAVPLLGIVVWQLLRDVPGRAATLSRVLLVPAVALYTAFDALVGIGTGVLMRGIDHLEAHHHGGAWALAQHWWDVPAPIVIVGVLGPLSWAVTVGAAAVAHWRAGSNPAVPIGLAVNALLFAWGHPGVTGVISMAGLLTAVVVREWWMPRRAGHESAVRA
jgi:hypothetical protein